ncbi:MAG: thioredoxin domain-containing protein [Rhodocyclales bacterium]|nr:thioredoxin domain-containing protein [Rhodocyclales bacterium]
MPNRLATETSPYLLQHADNPVDWQPWGAEALDQARRQDRPILLSIGYSACHWCHVMAHESFEDEPTAALMNREFINIKVDREERPDLDQIYQSAHQLLTGRAGGWPLTMFLAPDGMPFFGGTYFPNHARHGLPGFTDLLAQIAAAYRTQREAITQQNGALGNALARAAAVGGAAAQTGALSAAPLQRLCDQLAAAYDETHGGFGDAPKFPHPTDLAFLLYRYRSAAEQASRDMALTTLRRMAEGGLYDQLGGGFCRYSTDARWQIPHFEKMLYDNGALLGLYAQAWQIDGDPLYRRIVDETAAWAMREMQSPAGGYYAALDADSEGEEGRYYVWDRDEPARLLDSGQLRVAQRVYGLDGTPNFEGRAWHLCIRRPLAQVANELGWPLAQAEALLAQARARLFEARAGRVRPGLDDKLLTGWNALMIAGMARAARVFGRDEWLASARRALAFVREHLWRDGRLLAVGAGGAGRLNAYLDDHAFLIEALIELMQGRFEADDLSFARELADALLDSFEDRAEGGYFFTRDDHEALIQRPKPLHDNAMASGNGVAALALLRLGHLTGEARYLEAGERVVRWAWPVLETRPEGCASLVRALAELLSPPTVVVVRGGAVELAEWQAALRVSQVPDTLCLFIADGVANLPPVLDKPRRDRVNAWVCRGVNCLSPLDSIAALEQTLHELPPR